jgi:Zn-dependent protease with chaperone function
VAGRAKSAALTAAMAVLAHPVLVAGALVTAAAGLLLDGLDGVLLPVAWVGIGVAAALARRPGLPGREVGREAEPDLVELVDRVAGAVGFGQRVVVRIVPEPTASLARPRVAGTRTYVLMLGWPFLRLLARAELEAVVAHELAHRVELTSAAFRALSRSRRRLADGLERRPRVPAALAGRLLRASQARTWALELAADRASANVAGPAAASGALTRTATLGVAFERLVPTWIDVATGRGRFPEDLYEAVADALADPQVERRARLLAAEEEAVDPYAAADHPPLSGRLAALPRVPPVRYDPAPVPIRDPVGLEEWCLRDLLDQLDAEPGALEPFILRDAEPSAYLPPVWEAYSALRVAAGTRSTDAAVAAALDAVENGGWVGLAESVEPGVRRLPPLLRRPAARDVLAGCLGVAVAGRLLDRGWRRASRWLASVVRSPAGEVRDLQEMVTTAVDSGDAGPLRDLLAAPTAAR